MKSHRVRQRCGGSLTTRNPRNDGLMTSPILPRVAYCDFVAEAKVFPELAPDPGLQGIDWSFTGDDLPTGDAGMVCVMKVIAQLSPP